MLRAPIDRFNVPFDRLLLNAELGFIPTFAGYFSSKDGSLLTINDIVLHK